MKRVVLALFALAACGNPHGPEPIDPLTPKDGIHLDWRMTLEADRLRIDYTVTNGTEQRIYLLDRLIHGASEDPDAIIVMNGTTPGVVAFARMYVPSSPRYKPLTAFPPEARPVDAATNATGTAFAPWPLRAWHNFTMVDPLEEPLTSAVLWIGYTLEAGPARYDDMLRLTGSTQPLPHPD